MSIGNAAEQMTKRDYEAAKRDFEQRGQSKAAERKHLSPQEQTEELRRRSKRTAELAEIITEAELLRDVAKEIDNALAAEKGLQQADEKSLEDIIDHLSFGSRRGKDRQSLEDKIRQIWRIKDSIRREMERAEHAKSGKTADEADLAAANLREKLNKLVA